MHFAKERKRSLPANKKGAEGKFCKCCLYEINEMMLVSLTGSGKCVLHVKPFTVITLVLGHLPLLFIRGTQSTFFSRQLCSSYTRISVREPMYNRVPLVNHTLPCT